MNKMSICLQGFIIALFALSAANNFCMNQKDGEPKELDDSWMNGSVIEQKERLSEDVKKLLIHEYKTGMYTDIKEQVTKLQIKQKENIGRPSAFIYILAYASPYLSCLVGLAAGGLTLLKGTNGDPKGVACAAGVGSLGFGLTSKLCDSLFVSKVENHKRKTEKIEHEIEVLTPLYNNILARKKLFPEE